MKPFLHWILLAGGLLLADAIDARGAEIAAAGECVSTPNGRRVCRLAHDLSHGAVMGAGFCMSWQDPFRPVDYGQQLPFHQGWLRRVGYGWESRWGTMQIHIEGKGWVP